MNIKTILTITIAFRNDKDIKEVQDLSKEVKGYKQADIYLAGLRSLAGMNKKAKALVK
uniref:Uncharacterized protein n=1 Tax=viral metagenome TaxID=1070528 RepID=A0A6M3LPE8_9ZZZZ